MASTYLKNIEKSLDKCSIKKKKGGLFEGLLYEAPQPKQPMNGMNQPQTDDMGQEPMPNDEMNQQPMGGEDMNQEPMGDDEMSNNGDFDQMDDVDDMGELNADTPEIENILDEIRKLALNGMAKLSDKKYILTPEYDALKKIFLMIDKSIEEKEDPEMQNK